LSIPQMILLQNGACGLNGGPSQYGGFKIVSEGSGVTIFSAGVRIEFENQCDEECQHEKGKKQGYASFILRSAIWKDTGGHACIDRRRDCGRQNDHALA